MPYRTRIKVCGITREEDALAAVAEGVDAIGLVFYPPSPRCVALETAAAIARRIPAFVDIVALFVDASRDRVEEVVDRIQPDLLQFHGDEDAAYCGGFQRAYIKALRVQKDSELLQAAQHFCDARALLLDSFTAGTPGGTGQTFDWHLIPPALRSNILLAGGLDSDNVGDAIRLIKPYGVDVSGGVERHKGIKDAAKISRFVQQVSIACQSISGEPRP